MSTWNWATENMRRCGKFSGISGELPGLGLGLTEGANCQWSDHRPFVKGSNREMTWGVRLESSSSEFPCSCDFQSDVCISTILKFHPCTPVISVSSLFAREFQAQVHRCLQIEILLLGAPAGQGEQ